MHFAHIGACVLWREGDGSVRCECLTVDNILLACKGRLSQEAWGKLERLVNSARVRLIDLTEKDIVSGVYSDSDLRNKAGGNVRYEMRKLEAQVLEGVLKDFLRAVGIADGSLLFEPIRSNLSSLNVIPEL